MPPALTDLTARVPERVLCIFARTDDGAPATSLYTVSVTLASLALDPFRGVTGFAGEQLLHSTATAEYVSAALSNEAEMLALATQIATDYYLWQLGRLDLKYAGVATVDPDGFCDWIEWTHLQGEISTRIFPPPQGDYPERLWHHGAAVIPGDCCLTVRESDNNPIIPDTTLLTFSSTYFVVTVGSDPHEAVVSINTSAIGLRVKETDDTPNVFPVTIIRFESGHFTVTDDSGGQVTVRLNPAPTIVYTGGSITYTDVTVEYTDSTTVVIEDTVEIDLGGVNIVNNTWTVGSGVTLDVTNAAWVGVIPCVNLCPQVPRWTRITVDYDHPDLFVPSQDVTLTIYNLPEKGIIQATLIKHLVEWDSPGGLGDVTATVITEDPPVAVTYSSYEIANNPVDDRNSNLYDPMAHFSEADNVPSWTQGATPIKVRFTANGADYFDDATQGSVEIHLLVATLA